MKRTDLPSLAVTTDPAGKQIALVRGSASGVHLGTVINLPEGLDGHPYGGPLVAIVFPAFAVKTVEWSDLEKIAQAEQAERV